MTSASLVSGPKSANDEICISIYSRSRINWQRRPAEMLGVNAGLGYFILDTRDRMAYGELMACVLFIGLLGFALDWLARLAHRRWSGA